MEIQFVLVGETQINVKPNGKLKSTIEVPPQWRQIVSQSAPGLTSLTKNDGDEFWTLSVGMTDKERATVPLESYKDLCRKKFNRTLAALNAALQAVDDKTLPAIPSSWTNPLAVSSSGTNFGYKD